MLYLINYSKRNAVLFHSFLMLNPVPVHAKSRNAPCRFLTKRRKLFAVTGKDGDFCQGSVGEASPGQPDRGAGPVILRGWRELAPRGLGSGESSPRTAALRPQPRVPKPAFVRVAHRAGALPCHTGERAGGAGGESRLSLREDGGGAAKVWLETTRPCPLRKSRWEETY